MKTKLQKNQKILRFAIWFNADILKVSHHSILLYAIPLPDSGDSSLELGMTGYFYFLGGRKQERFEQDLRQ